MSKNTMVLTRKVRLQVVGDKEEVNRVYDHLRTAIKTQNEAMNQCITALYVAQIMGMENEDKRELRNLYGRIPNSKKGSAYSKDMVFPTGSQIASSVQRNAKMKFDKSLKDGLMYGKVSLPTFRDDNPLYLPVNFIKLSNSKGTCGFWHPYESNETFYQKLFDKDLEVFFTYVNGITFKFIFGNPHSSNELRTVFGRIFSSEYKLCGSSIELMRKVNNKTGQKIILNPIQK